LSQQAARGPFSSYQIDPAEMVDELVVLAFQPESQFAEVSPKAIALEQAVVFSANY